MHINYKIESDKFKLVNVLDGGNYIISYNAKKEMTEEEKFKNSAFVKTGRLIPTGFTTSWSFVTATKPTINKIRQIIYNDIDKFISNKILSGMIWNGYNVWLSTENQKNYSDWYLLANNAEKIPSLTAKFTKNGKNVYYEFSTKEEIESLYVTMIKHINDTVNLGRKMKDEIDLIEYKNCLDKL